MKDAIRSNLCKALLEMADDELILGHRDAEWTGHAPILEEDISFSNIAQDELGHAMIWFGLLSDLDQSDPDKLAFFRNPEEFQNVLLAELPNGDWAFTIVRQYIFDMIEIIKLEELRKSAYKPLADAAEKIIKEETYHVMHTSAWVTRLGKGTEESHRRMQNAVDLAWPYVFEFFDEQEYDDILVAEGILPDKANLQEKWLNKVTTHIRQSGLDIPDNITPMSGGRTGQHTKHLKALLEEMQIVARWEPDAKW